MGGNLFMAHIDDLNPLVDASVINIHNVPAGNGEDVLDAFLFQHPGDDLPGRSDRIAVVHRIACGSVAASAMACAASGATCSARKVPAATCEKTGAATSPP